MILLEEKKPKKKKKLPKEVVNIIRTTQRNNIELTHIADNKANVLLSLNALMITFLLPLVVANTQVILEEQLYIPLIILAATCFVTIYICTIVLKPSNLKNFRDNANKDGRFSPFFFGNFYRMEPQEFFTYIKKTASKPGNVRGHLAEDLYYVGRRLAHKMNYIRIAFTIFISGLFLSLASTGLILWLL
ncbi:MAG: hypothetical protein KTR30_33570 [Saprospiraceae bacterium]|nr:hypothetical protein [Saprospiraceae bacterium]